jgi:hypothetical protein
LLGGLKANGINIGALLPFFLAISFQKARTIKHAVFYGLGIAAFIRTLTFISYTAAFGTNASREKLLPFYELARLIYINRFIQRIESFYIVLWSIVGILNITIDIYAALYLLCRLFNLPLFRPFIVPVSITLAILASIPMATVDVIALYSQLLASYYNIGAIVIPLVLFAAALYRARRQKVCQIA